MFENRDNEDKPQPLYPMSATTSDDHDDKKKIAKRGEWSLKIEYLLSVIGFIVGLGNFWRFPYICSRNGGGAFLIPYVICLVLCGLPLFFLELAIGQFSGRSTVHVWSVCPLMKGMGIGMTIIAAICPIYYMVISALSVLFIVFSCSAVLPWTTCNNTWNTNDCVTSIKLLQQVSSGALNYTTGKNHTGYGTLTDNSTHSYTLGGMKNQSLSHTAAEEFLQYKALDITDGLQDMGQIKWELVLCLLASWAVVFICLMKGVKSAGKAVYVTATLPYVFLITLLVRGLTLPGGSSGALFYLTPRFGKLLEIQVWLEAFLQVFYSLGPTWGALITMSSYNKFHVNCLRDAVICTFASEGTSIFSGLVVFSVLGFMAHEADIPITDVVSSGPGLGFVIYPEALSQLPLPQVWSFIFFVMLILLVMDSMFSLVEAIICAIMDEFPFLLRWRTSVTAAYCFASFLLGLLLTAQGGMYVFQLIDWYTGAIFPIFAGFCECIILGWVYGIQRFSADVEMMIGRKPPVFFKITWCFITPLMLAVTFVFTLSQYTLPTYGNYIYPDYAASIGWFISAIPMLPILPMMVLAIYREEGSLLQRLKQSLTPAESWGPSKSSYRQAYHEKYGRRMHFHKSCLQETCVASVSCKSQGDL